jgi:hypothetical protein
MRLQVGQTAPVVRLPNVDGADFLIDEEGHIVQAYYGKDEGDHLPLSEIEKFAARVRSFSRGSE